MPAHLGPRSAAVLDFIRTEVTAGMGIPSPRRIGCYMGWKGKQSGRDALLRLAAAGYLSITIVDLPRGRWRYAYVLRDPSDAGVPERELEVAECDLKSQKFPSGDPNAKSPGRLAAPGL